MSPTRAPGCTRMVRAADRSRECGRARGGEQNPRVRDRRTGGARLSTGGSHRRLIGVCSPEQIDNFVGRGRSCDRIGPEVESGRVGLVGVSDRLVGRDRNIPSRSGSITTLPVALRNVTTVAERISGSCRSAARVLRKLRRQPIPRRALPRPAPNAPGGTPRCSPHSHPTTYRRDQ